MVTKFEIEALRHSYMRQKNYAALEGVDACLKLFSEDEDAKPSFWKKHKGKILGGLGALALAGTTGALGAYGGQALGRIEGRAEEAVSQARDAKSPKEIGDALTKIDGVVAYMKANPGAVTERTKDMVRRAINEIEKKTNKADMVANLRRDVDGIVTSKAVEAYDWGKTKAREGMQKLKEWRGK